MKYILQMSIRIAHPNMDLEFASVIHFDAVCFSADHLELSLVHWASEPSESTTPENKIHREHKV